jgi:protein SCO1/2
MNNSTLPYWLTFAVLVAALYGGFKWYQVERGRVGVETNEINLPPLEEFALTASDGTPFRSKEMKGKVWIASFFFSTCPGTCKQHNANIKYMSSLDEIAEADWVSITVDPATDTLPVLAEYAKTMNADPERWIFCRGDFEYVKRVASDILHLGGVSLKGHNDYAVIVDKHGEIAGMFNALSTKECERGVEMVKKCLAQQYKPSDATSVSERAGSSTIPAAAEAA